MRAFCALCLMFSTIVTQILSVYYVTENEGTIKAVDIDSWVLPTLGMSATCLQTLALLFLMFRCVIPCAGDSSRFTMIIGLFSGISLLFSVAYLSLVIYVFVKWNNVLSGNIVGIKVNACSTTDMCANAETSMVISAVCVLFNMVSLCIVWYLPSTTSRSRDYYELPFN